MSALEWDGGSFMSAVSRATFRPTTQEAILSTGVPLAGDVFDLLAEQVARTFKFHKVVLVHWGDPNFPIRVFALEADGSVLVAAPRRVERLERFEQALQIARADAARAAGMTQSSSWSSALDRFDAGAASGGGYHQNGRKR